MHEKVKFPIKIIGSRISSDHLKFNEIFIHAIDSEEYQRIHRIVPGKNFRIEVRPNDTVQLMQLLMFLVDWPNFCNANKGNFETFVDLLNICVECT